VWLGVVDIIHFLCFTLAGILVSVDVL